MVGDSQFIGRPVAQITQTSVGFITLDLAK